MFLIDTERTDTYPIIKLIVLVLVLPITSASGERAFSAMKIIKTRLRSKMSQDFLQSLMLVGIEKELADSISNNQIIDRYHAVGPRRGAAHFI